MAKPYRAYLPEQDLLLPPSLGDWLPEDHSANFVSDVVDQLDLSTIESVYEKEERGQPPYHPRMMTKILLYGYCVGVFSSRGIEKKLAEDRHADRRYNYAAIVVSVKGSSIAYIGTHRPN